MHTAFRMIVSLDFERDQIRPALGAFDKTVVEDGNTTGKPSFGSCCRIGTYRSNTGRFANRAFSGFSQTTPPPFEISRLQQGWGFSRSLSQQHG
jgi:hypothetical protein